MPSFTLIFLVGLGIKIFNTYVNSVVGGFPEYLFLGFVYKIRGCLLKTYVGGFILVCLHSLNIWFFYVHATSFVTSCLFGFWKV